MTATNVEASGPAADEAPGPHSRPGPARYTRVFIVTYGRSGSTLLQGVLNAIPGYLVRGENNDMMGELKQLWDRFPRFSDLRGERADGTLPQTTSAQAFYGFERFRDDRLAAALRELCDTMLCDRAQRGRLRSLGFKEIRYTPEDVSAKVDFLRLIYPGCAIIYNTRRPEDVVASEFQRNKPVAHFRRFNQVLEELASLDSRACLVRYEDVVAGRGTLLALYDFLGERFVPKRLAKVLAVKHSYHAARPGSAYSDIPAAVTVSRKIPDIEMFVVRRLTADGATATVEGLLLTRAGKPEKQFASLLDRAGRSVPFAARYRLPSPNIAKKLGTEVAAKARFELSFTPTGQGEYRLFFGGGKLAAVVRPSGQVQG